MERRSIWRRSDRLVGIQHDPNLSRPVVAAGVTADFIGAQQSRKIVPIFLAVTALPVLESIFAGTALITPISPAFLWSMRLGGLLIGLALVPAVLSTSAYSDAIWPRRFLIKIAVPLLLVVAFDGFAWRAADWWEFGLSNQEFKPRSYPIVSVMAGRRGRRDVFEIDPYSTGEKTPIPLPSGQFYTTHETAIGQCVSVMARQSPNGTVEIRTDGRFTMSTPTKPHLVELAPCSDSSRAARMDPE